MNNLHIEFSKNVLYTVGMKNLKIGDRVVQKLIVKDKDGNLLKGTILKLMGNRAWVDWDVGASAWVFLDELKEAPKNGKD